MTFHSQMSAPSMSTLSAPDYRVASPKRVTNLASLFALLSFLGLCVAPLASFAIESPFIEADARAAEQATAEEFASFPAPARRAALVAAGYPESILEIQRLQQNSADRFAALVESYPRETQAQIWDLVRYPGLASDIARGGKKSSDELDNIADRYPDADHLAIIEEGKKRYELWVQIYSLDLESQQSLSAILAGEPAEVQVAFDEVTARPDLMSLLAENIQWTTVQGAAYRENPAQVDARFETLAAQVAAQRRSAESDWANEVSDPESAEELETAAREFADEYGYDYEDGLGEHSPRRTGSNTTIIIQQRVNPYPYWAGYPTWYGSAFWYPLSFSSHIGFGYRGGNGFGFGRSYASFGLPSPFFLGWYHDVYRPRFARNNFGNRGLRRSIRYYDNHRPNRSASHRRHNRGRDRVGVGSSRDRSRDRTRVERRQNRRDNRFQPNRNRRSHTDALADRALRGRRDGRVDRQNNSRTERRDRRDRVQRRGDGIQRRGDGVQQRRDGVRQRRDGVNRRRDGINQRRNNVVPNRRSQTREQRTDRNVRSQARQQARSTRDNNLGRGDQRGTRQIRANQRGNRNPAIRAGGRPAQRLAERRNDGVRRSPRLRQARASVPRVSKRERSSQRKIARSERRSATRIARADRKATRKQARVSSGGGQSGKRRVKAAKQSRPQRASKSNRSGGGSRKNKSKSNRRQNSRKRGS